MDGYSINKNVSFIVWGTPHKTGSTTQADTAESVASISPLIMVTPSFFMDVFTARRGYTALKMMVGNELVGTYGKVTYIKNFLIEFKL